MLTQLQDKFPGVEFNFSQYLQDNVSEAVSGVKGENSIKLYGNDLQALTDTANKIKQVLSTVQGVTDLAVFTSLGQPTIQIDIDRARAARYGLSPGDINATIQRRDRRRFRRRPLRARQRPAFSDHRSPGAGIPQERGGDPEFAHRRRRCRAARSRRFP